MKRISVLLAAVLLTGFASSNAFAESCCEKAKKEGKACDHKCCVEAAKNKKSCEKCHPKKKDEKK